MYVGDVYNYRIQKFSPTGTYLTQWGTPGSGPGQFNGATRIAVGPSGNVYVLDSALDRVQEFMPDGTFVTKWGRRGNGPGQFKEAGGIGTDTLGHVFVADSGNDRVQEFTAAGKFLTQWGRTGTGDGEFRGPMDIEVDADGTTYVADWKNTRIQEFVPWVGLSIIAPGQVRRGSVATVRGRLTSTRPECRSGVNVSLLSGSSILATKPVGAKGGYRFRVHVGSTMTVRVGSDGQLFGVTGTCASVLSAKRTIRAT